MTTISAWWSRRSKIAQAIPVSLLKIALTNLPREVALFGDDYTPEECS